MGVMDPAVIATLVVSIVVAIFASITAPLILAHRTERMHREDRLSDYERQDKVAAAAAKAAEDLRISQKAIADQAAEAARLLLEAQQESIERTDEVARVAAAEAVKANAKLDQIDLQAKRIHTLVNSDMTAARQSELDQSRAMGVVLRRVIDLAVSTPGVEPDPRDITALRATDTRISELEAILADRLAQMRIVEADAAENPIAEGGGAGE